MQVPGAEQALSPEPGALHHPVRRLVADHDEGVQADRSGGSERPIRHQSKGPGAHARPRASGASHRPNVAWCPSGPKRVTAPSRRSATASTIANAAPVPSRHIVRSVLDERVRIGGQEWLGVGRHVRSLGPGRRQGPAGASAGRHGRRMSSSMVRVVPGSPSTGPFSQPRINRQRRPSSEA